MNLNTNVVIRNGAWITHSPHGPDHSQMESARGRESDCKAFLILEWLMELLYLPQCLLSSDMQKSDMQGACGLLPFKSSCEPPALHKCNTTARCYIIGHIKPGPPAEFHHRVSSETWPCCFVKCIQIKHELNAIEVIIIIIINNNNNNNNVTQ